jgi:hypothetical protein
VGPSLAISAVQKQRRRLLSPRTRRGLARALEDIVEQAAVPSRPQLRPLPPLFDARVIASVADDLQAVARLLLSDSACARGVALAERLITPASSSLYGQQVEPLREELRRLRTALDPPQNAHTSRDASHSAADASIR